MGKRSSGKNGLRSIKDAASEIGINPETLRRKIRRGDLKEGEGLVKWGRLQWIDWPVFQDFLRKKQQKASA